MLSVFGKLVAMTSWIINFYITSTREMGWEYIGLGTGVMVTEAWREEKVG